MRSTIVENNFLKVLIVTQRAKQIQRGGRPHIDMPERRATRVSLEEVERGLISYEFMEIPPSPDNVKV